MKKTPCHSLDGVVAHHFSERFAMQDDSREFTKSLLSFLWALPLFGTEQLARLFVPRGSYQRPGRVAAAFNAVTRTTKEQLDASSMEIFQAGDALQSDMVDMVIDLLTLEARTPRRLTKLTFDAMQQSAAVGSFLTPGHYNRFAWQECKNKLEAFNLFEYVDVALDLPAEPDVLLPALVAKAEALGPYRAVWAMEGLGRYYAEAYWTHKGTPRELLAADQARALPLRSLIPLHTGMGLAFADRILASLTPQSSEAAVGMALQQFIALCRHNSRDGYTGAALEALGLVTRHRSPRLVLLVDQLLSGIEPDMVGYFWHGVGRGLYFLPINALPCSRSTWRAVEMSQGEAPHTLGRLNALAGLAWAQTLVNIRHPEILEAFLKQHGGVLPENDAFSHGVSSALMIWYDMKRDAPYLRAFCQHQPDANDRELTQCWHSQVRRPCQHAVQHYYGVLKTQYGLGEVFRYQPLPELVERLKRKQAQ
jgi:hypothetical protein